MIRPLFIAIFCWMLLTCKSRLQTSDLRISHNSVGWFLDASQPLTICVNASRNVREHLAEGGEVDGILKYSIWRTFMSWIVYLDRKNIQPLYELPQNLGQLGILKHRTEHYGFLKAGMSYGWLGTIVPVQINSEELPKPKTNPTTEELKSSFPSSIRFVNNCDDAEIELHFGTQPSFSDDVAQEPKSVLARSHLSPTKSKSGRLHGAIVLVDHGEELNYDDRSEMDVLLMHEWGHVFGVPHITGTIMDPEEIADFFLDAKVTRNILTPFERIKNFEGRLRIDHWRQLTFCRGGGWSPCLVSGDSLIGLEATALVSSSGGLQSLDVKPAQRDAGEKKYIVAVKESGGDKIEIKEKAPNKDKSINADEIFRRPGISSIQPIFHQSQTVERWISGDYVLTTEMNTNDKSQKNLPSVRAMADCSGRSFSIFNNETYHRSGEFNIVPFEPNNTHFADRAARELNLCTKVVGDIFKVKVAQLSEPERAEREKLIPYINLTLNSGKLQLLNDQPPRAYIVSEELRCRPFAAGIALCFWQKENIGIMQLRSRDAIQTCFPTEIYLSETDQKATGFKQSWGCEFNLSHADWPKDEKFRPILRINLQKRFSFTSVNPAVIDIFLGNGLWYRFGQIEF